MEKLSTLVSEIPDDDYISDNKKLLTQSRCGSVQTSHSLCICVEKRSNYSTAKYQKCVSTALVLIRRKTAPIPGCNVMLNLEHIPRSYIVNEQR
jgi:hypothetical protein